MVALTALGRPGWRVVLFCEPVILHFTRTKAGKKFKLLEELSDRISFSVLSRSSFSLFSHYFSLLSCRIHTLCMSGASKSKPADCTDPNYPPRTVTIYPCSRINCPCLASHDGQQGNYCCLSCRDGTACVLNSNHWWPGHFYPSSWRN